VHVRHTEQSRKEVEADVRDGLRELHRQGVHPRFWRPPWGVLAPFTAEIAYAFGLEIALWTRAAKTGGGTRPPRCWNAWNPDFDRALSY
jgi:hypothetical protein